MYRKWPSEFDYSQAAPKGHLPLTNALRGTQLFQVRAAAAAAAAGGEGRLCVGRTLHRARAQQGRTGSHALPRTAPAQAIMEHPAFEKKVTKSLDERSAQLASKPLF